MNALRLGTYNIHKFIGADGRKDAGRVISVIRALGADVLALQEFTDDAAAGAQEFAAAMGYRAVEQKMLRGNGRHQSNLLLSRLPLRSPRLIDLKVEGQEPRGAIVAVVEAGGHRLHVVTTHLGLRPAARKRQLDAILGAFDLDPAQPFALLGDLNAILPWEGAERRLGRDFPGQARPPSFPARRPVLALDRIVVRPARMLRSLRVFADAPARVASDHLPLVADLVLS